MAAAAHHENITLFTCCDLKWLDPGPEGISAGITQRPRHGDAKKRFDDVPTVPTAVPGGDISADWGPQGPGSGVFRVPESLDLF